MGQSRALFWSSPQDGVGFSLIFAPCAFDEPEIIVRFTQSYRCLIPGSDGAIFSREWRDALPIHQMPGLNT